LAGCGLVVKNSQIWRKNMATELQKYKASTAFLLLDSDKSGSVTADDFERLAKSIASIKYSPDSSEYRDVVEKYLSRWTELQKAVDKNSDSKVTLDEFVDYYVTIVDQPDMVNKFVVHLFDQADVNGDGKITASEFLLLSLIFGQHPFQSAPIFYQLDADKDGSITKEEFLNNPYALYTIDQ
jgi:Ca2+-binding EF-hand superfamily protein